MSVSGIGNSYSYVYHFPPPIDSEEMEIMRRLLAYGITPSGDKSADRAKLHQIEREKAKEEPTVSSSKFFTVSAQEQNNIHDKKKQNQKEKCIGLDALSNYNKAFIGQKIIY